MGNYSLIERETIFRYDSSDDVATVCTFNKAMQAKLEKLAQENPDDVKITRTYPDNDGIIIEMPKQWIKIRTPMKLTPEQREKRRQRAKSNLGV